MPDLIERVLAEVYPGSDVLDVGSGFGFAGYLPGLLARAGRLVLLDAHLPYLIAKPPPEAAIAVVGEARKVLPVFGDRAFHVAFGIDFIEHLTLEDALVVVEGMKRVASKVVLFVPEGEHPQTKDVYGLGGDRWQTHRRTWHPMDLEALGFAVERWPDFHKHETGKAPGAMFAVWTSGFRL